MGLDRDSHVTCVLATACGRARAYERTYDHDEARADGSGAMQWQVLAATLESRLRSNFVVASPGPARPSHIVSADTCHSEADAFSQLSRNEPCIAADGRLVRALPEGGLARGIDILQPSIDDLLALWRVRRARAAKTGVERVPVGSTEPA